MSEFVTEYQQKPADPKPDVKWLNFREAIGECQMCHNTGELRPYGKGGAWVCFDCGMQDEAEARRRFGDLINEKSVTVIDVRI